MLLWALQIKLAFSDSPPQGNTNGVEKAIKDYSDTFRAIVEATATSPKEDNWGKMRSFLVEDSPNLRSLCDNIAPTLATGFAKGFKIFLATILPPEISSDASSGYSINAALNFTSTENERTQVTTTSEKLRPLLSGANGAGAPGAVAPDHGTPAMRHAILNFLQNSTDVVNLLNTSKNPELSSSTISLPSDIRAKIIGFLGTGAHEAETRACL